VDIMPIPMVSTMTESRWIAHPGHCTPPWTDELRRELVAAFRRGTMNAERCLRAYRDQGEAGVLPPEAVVYLAARVVADRSIGAAERARFEGMLSAEALSDHGERELAALYAIDREGFEGLVEAGRRFFFPGR
jgi:hypothetical protein